MDSVSQLLKANYDFDETEPIKVFEQLTPIDETKLLELQRNDPKLKDIIDFLENDTLPENVTDARRVQIESQNYVMDGNDNKILFHFYFPRGKKENIDNAIKQLALPGSLIGDILKGFHDFSSHLGFDKTYLAVRQKFFWKGQYKDVQDYIRSCTRCQMSKRNYGFVKAPLTPLPTPTRPFELVQLDLAGPFPEDAEGNKYIAVFICAFTKFPIAVPLKNLETKTIVKIFYEHIVTYFGKVEYLLTDNGTNLVSKLMNALCDYFKIQKLKTSPYHPMSNGLCEKMVGIITQGLRTHSSTLQRNWSAVLPHILYAYRFANCSRSHEYSPYELLFGYKPKSLIETALPPLPLDMARDDRTTFEEIAKGHEITRELARQNIVKSKEKYTKQYNDKVKVPDYQENDLVLLQNMQRSVGKCPKLQDKYLGPYRIEQAYANCTYKLRRLSDNFVLRNKVHANRLKRFYDPVIHRRGLDRHVKYMSPQSEDTRDNGQRNMTRNRRTDVREETRHHETLNGQPGSQADRGIDSQTRRSDPQENIFKAKKLLRKQVIRGKIHYLVLWSGGDKSIEPIENILDYELIRRFNRAQRRRRR
ncbi:MAG: DDE-type integrase/transposase/recombinase [Sedimenticola sp.]